MKVPFREEWFRRLPVEYKALYIYLSHTLRPGVAREFDLGKLGDMLGSSYDIRDCQRYFGGRLSVTINGTPLDYDERQLDLFSGAWGSRGSLGMGKVVCARPGAN